MSKKLTKLNGQAIMPVRVGSLALIAHNGHNIRTSMVVAILEVSESQIVIETQNTVYCIVSDTGRQNAEKSK